MKRLLIADDHTLVRYGLKIALNNHFDDCQIDESWDGASVMEQLNANTYDLVLLDLNMPETDPSVLLHWIKNFHKETKVLVVSMNEENIYGKRTLEMGAQGYLKKDSSPTELFKAISTVLAGRKYVSTALGDMLMHDTINGNALNPFDRLAPREFQIAMHLVQDHSLAEIGEMLNIQYVTVSTLKRRILEKLGIKSMKALVQLAEAYGIS